VVSNIRNGLIKYDTWCMLRQRIDGLPSQIYRLYTDMWNRLNEDNAIYRAESAYYFNVLLNFHNHVEPSGSCTLIHVLLASDVSLQRALLEGGSELQANRVLQQCGIFRHQLLSRCAGLIEVAEPLAEIIENLAELSPVWAGCFSEVHFIHKSAADFFLDTLEGHDILRQDKTSLYQLQVRLEPAYLAKAILFTRMTRGTDLSYCFGKVAEAPSVLRDHQSLLLELVRATMQRLPEWHLSQFNFVCIAAEFCLGKYVKRQFQEHHAPPTLSSSDWKNMLLAYACQYHDNLGNDYPHSRLDLITRLLDEGADLNSEVQGTGLIGKTPFACFVHSLYDDLLYKDDNGI
jgi:hypothetical protein